MHFGDFDPTNYTESDFFVAFFHNIVVISQSQCPQSSQTLMTEKKQEANMFSIAEMNLFFYTQKCAGRVKYWSACMMTFFFLGNDMNSKWFWLFAHNSFIVYLLHCVIRFSQINSISTRTKNLRFFPIILYMIRVYFQINLFSYYNKSNQWSSIV